MNQNKDKYLKPVSIESLIVWTYKTQKADIAIDRGVGLFEQEKKTDGREVRKISGDGCFQIAQNKMLGATIHNSCFAGLKIHPDSEVVHQFIETLPAVEKGLVKDYGRTELIPDWMPDAVPVLEPDIRPNGKPRIIYDDSRNASMMVMKERLSFDEIVYKRQVYSRWWEAMHGIMLHFQENRQDLSVFEVTHMEADSMPWGAEDLVMQAV